MFSRLRKLGPRPDGREVQRALQQAYLTGLALLAAPGLLLGLLLGWQLRAAPDLQVVLVGVALVVALLAVYLAFRAARPDPDPSVSPFTPAVRASLQLASAPAVPFLMGCAFLGDPPTLLLLWGTSIAAGLLGLIPLHVWAGSATAVVHARNNAPA